MESKTQTCDYCDRPMPECKPVGNSDAVVCTDCVDRFVARARRSVGMPTVDRHQQHGQTDAN